MLWCDLRIINGKYKVLNTEPIHGNNHDSQDVLIVETIFKATGFLPGASVTTLLDYIDFFLL